MALDIVQKALAQKIAAQAAWTEIEARGQQVDEYRKYFDGDHPANLTDEMRKLLRTTRRGAEFTDNYCERVVHARADRCIVSRVEADNDAATTWAQDVLDNSRFDALQLDVHEATFRDADTYVMVSFDNDAKTAVFTHELAYDGTSGIIPIYKSTDVPDLDAVIKVWHLTSDDGKHTDITRVNVYYPDRIEKFITGDDGLEKYIDPNDVLRQWPIDWTDSAGQPLGVPFVHFRNQGRHNFGISTLEKVIGLQDALNRVLHSLVMTGELTAFQILVAIGFEPPDSITPGAFLAIAEGGLSKEDQVSLDAIKAGDLSQLIAEANWLKFELHNVSNTPNPEMIGTNISGEALKQHESFLIGEIKRFCVKAGESWEHVLKLAAAQSATFGGQAPEFKRFYTKWNSPELRNTAEIVGNAKLVADKISDAEFLRLVAEVFDWDETKIEQILAESKQQKADDIAMQQQAMPNFANAQF